MHAYDRRRKGILDDSEIGFPFVISFVLAMRFHVFINLSYSVIDLGGKNIRLHSEIGIYMIQGEDNRHNFFTQSVLQGGIVMLERIVNIQKG